MSGAYRSPQVAGCTRCAAPIPDGGMLSTSGDPLCRRCFYAGEQAVLDARAQVERQKLTHSAEGVDALDDVRKVDARAREIRRCAKCGDPGVRVEHVTFHFGQRGWSLPRGRTYRHRCSACGVSFHTESALRMACAGGLGLFLLAIWSKIGAGHYTHWVSLLTFFAGASMVGFTAWRVVARLRNPLVPT